MSLRLSRAEIAKLRRTPHKVRQHAFLRQNCIWHHLDAYGWPVVTRAAVEGMKDSEQADWPWKPARRSTEKLQKSVFRTALRLTSRESRYAFH